MTYDPLLMSVDLPVVHDNGMFINAKISRVVELIREYDPRLDVMWIPPNQRGASDPAFAIVERLGDGRTVVAFYVQSEQEFDERVLERIILGDNTKHDVQARVEAQNLAVRAVAEAKRREEVAAFADFARSVITSRKHTYKHDGRKFAI
jgi:hypothetical protein